MLCGDSEERRAAAGARSWKERWRRLFSCHIISGAVVNKAPPRPPGPLHSRTQVGARFSSPRSSTAVNNGDIVSPPPPRSPSSAVTRARAAAAELALFIPGQMRTKWLFMPPKDPIVTEMRMHEPARVYRRFLETLALLSCISDKST